MLAGHLALADNSCQNHIIEVVQAQAKVDFPGQSLTVTAPDMQGYDGGEEKSIDVTVVRTENASIVVSTYGVTIDEVCSVEIQRHNP